MAEEEAGNEGEIEENVVQEEPAGDDEDEAINCKNCSVDRNKPRKNMAESDKASNRKKPSAETEDLFRLPDFDDDDNEEDEDYQPPPRVQGKKKAMIEDDEDEGNDINGDDDDDDEDEDYEEEDDDDDNDGKEDDDDNEEITLQKEKADERRKKSVRRSKDTDADVTIAEMLRGTGQWCANMGQATEFRNYIKSVMKTFKEHVRKGKQIKKYLVEMIQDVHEACMNMRYPGMNFDPEEIVSTFLDLSCKAWQAMLKEVEYADRNDLKEANARKTANILSQIDPIKMQHKWHELP